ncbi:MAG: nucleotidyltransferase family protein [Janthinobacterium lividum]
MKIAAIVLAAGTASRYRAADPSMPTKLVAKLDGVPLVRLVAESAVASRAAPVVAVTGHAEDAVRSALDGLPLTFVSNVDFASGMASSLRAGLAALPPDCNGALVLLADMPGVTAALLDLLIHTFEAGDGAEAVVPVHGGRRGNPALLGRALFAAALRLTGDEGARRLLAQARVVELPLESDAVLLDIDEPTTLSNLDWSRP